MATAVSDADIQLPIDLIEFNVTPSDVFLSVLRFNRFFNRMQNLKKSQSFAALPNDGSMLISANKKNEKKKL